MGLTLLAHASIPIPYWDHSFTTAVHLINKLPSSALPNFISPHEALFKTIPDYASLRSFGCTCFPLLTPYNKHKLQFHSQECINLGPSPHHKGFKCLSPNGRIYISNDVTFHEDSFPFPSLFKSDESSFVSNSSADTSDLPIRVSESLSPLSSNSTAPVPSTSSTESVPSVVPSTISPTPSSTEAIYSLPDTTKPSASASDQVTASVEFVSPPNIHPMLTRSKTGSLKPRLFVTHVAPTSAKQALA